TYPCRDLLNAIVFSDINDLSIYLSTGRNDAENYVGPLTSLYQTKAYRLKSVNHSGGHDFESWKAQLGPALQFLFPERE
ncbi:MAG: hypothetical protein AAFV80_16950, partial [Bacteroidota bacterium]